MTIGSYETIEFTLLIFLNSLMDISMLELLRVKVNDKAPQHAL